MELTVSEYKKLMQRIAELEEEVERLKSDNNGLRNELTRVRDWLADRQLSLVTKGLLESADAIEQQINAINDTLLKRLWADYSGHNRHKPPAFYNSRSMQPSTRGSDV